MSMKPQVVAGQANRGFLALALAATLAACTSTSEIPTKEVPRPQTPEQAFEAEKLGCKRGELDEDYSFPTPDGCNHCKCTSSGGVNCTKVGCGYRPG